MPAYRHLRPWVRPKNLHSWRATWVIPAHADVRPSGPAPEAYDTHLYPQLHHTRPSERDGVLKGTGVLQDPEKPSKRAYSSTAQGTECQPQRALTNR